MEPVSITHPEHQPAHGHLRPGIFRPYPGHLAAACFGTDIVHVGPVPAFDGTTLRNGDAPAGNHNT